ncbi:hypothetical protein BJ741DRAFT_598821 [Chytriomyces cf. hyalinus JEL632]|nr:hypothetical protein BJ741DRAFT_598821 [Chytriomyces cf. hyalinus JEL632]
MDTACASWSTPFTPVTNSSSGIVCIPPGSTSLTECFTMTDGTNSLWYANKTLSATHSTEYGVGTFFSYTANMTTPSMITFQVNYYGMGFHSDISGTGPVYENGTRGSSLCLRSTFPFLALVYDGVVSWNETTDPPFYRTVPQPSPIPSGRMTTTTSTVPRLSSPQVSSDSSTATKTWIYLLGSTFIVVMIYSWRGQATSQSFSGSSAAQPVIHLNGQRADEEALPAYQQSHEMESIVSTAPLVARPPESSAGLSVASGRISVAPSASGSAEVLLLESWSVEEVAAWVRLNGAGRAGAERVRENQMNGGVLAQLTVEEILQVFALEDDYEKDKLREALAVLKANNGETPPVYV